MNDAFRLRPDGVELRLRLTPRGGRDAMEGIAATADGRHHIVARVRAAPEGGAANAALERLVASWLGVPRGTVRVTAGATSRLKTLGVAGDPAELAARISELLGPAASGQER